MIKVQFMKPFYTKVTDTTLRLVFAYQYFSIEKDDEIYHFIPIEGKDMLIDLNTMQVKNLSEVFVFQRGNKFIRLPLYQLLLVSNIHEHLTPILDSVPEASKSVADFDEVLSPESEELVQQLESEMLLFAIDKALDAGNRELFMQLTDKLNSEVVA